MDINIKKKKKKKKITTIWSFLTTFVNVNWLNEEGSILHFFREQHVSWNRLIEAQILAVRCDTINVFLEMDIGWIMYLSRIFI